MNWHTKILLIITCLTLVISHTAIATPMSESVVVPEKTSDGWPVSSLKTQGINPTLISKMIKLIKNERYKGISSITLVRNNFLVVDEYFNGWSKDKLHSMKSASKSITSALVGIAIDKQYIASVDAKLLSYFPEYKGEISNWDDNKKQITLAHVLSMTSGVKGNEDAMYPTNDWIKFYLDQPLAYKPGSLFSYATSGVVTLGSVISRTSGLSIPEFTNQFLFQPLGINDYFWPITNSKGNQGLAMTGGGLKLTPRDMAKFGQLYLNKGQWKEQQVLSEQWIFLSTQKHSTSDLHGEDFGYLWRLMDRSIATCNIRSYEAWGNGGQFIMVFPTLELVVVFTGENYGKFPEMEQPFELVEQYILPAISNVCKSL